MKTLLDSGLAVENIKVDLRTSVIKPIHFGWLVKNMEWLSSQAQMLRRGWKDIGILGKLQINGLLCSDHLVVLVLLVHRVLVL